jgi:hypothetical protein
MTIDPEDEELLHRRLDGDLDEVGAARLERLIARDPAVAGRAAQIDSLAALLDEARAADAGEQPEPRPVAIRRSVTSQGSHRHNYESGGNVMARKVMWGIAAAAVVVLGLFALTGYPRVDRDTEGAIGQAKRAQAQQMDAKDVVLGDTKVQEFMQSDVFDKLMKDPDARQMLADASMRARLSDASLRAGLADSALSQALKSAEVRAAFADADLRGALADAQVRAALSDAAFRASLVDLAARKKLTDAAAKAALSSADLQAAMKKPQIHAALATAEMQAALASPAVRQALANPEIRASLADAAFQAALASDALQAALRSANFEAALKSQQFEAALRRP